MWGKKTHIGFCMTIMRERVYPAVYRRSVQDVRDLCEVYTVPKRRINERIHLATLETKKEMKKSSPQRQQIAVLF
jgi:hypothetical protein